MAGLITFDAHTDSVAVSNTAFSALIPTVNFSLLLANTVQIQAYNTLDPNVCTVQLLVDGNVVVDNVLGGVPLFLNIALGSGAHTIDYKAVAVASGVTTTTRGLTVVNLGLL